MESSTRVRRPGEPAAPVRGAPGRSAALGAAALLALVCAPCDPDDDAGAPDALPDAQATCDELVRAVLDYAARHAACSVDDDCVPVATYSGSSCLYCALEFGASWGWVPALRADAADEPFWSVARRLPGCCESWSSHGDGWSCTCIADAVWYHATAVCESGRCVGHEGPGPESCLDDPGDADADADEADADADAEVIDDDAGGDDDAEADIGDGCRSDLDCPPRSPCMFAWCSPDTHECCSRMAGDGWPCDDGLFCNGLEQCTGGRCLPHTEGLFFDDPCRIWSCDEATHSGEAVGLSPAGTPCGRGPGDCLAATCDGAGACVERAVPSCPPECCTNLRDDDGDDAVDCDDPDCLADPECAACRIGPEICWDGCDNDLDGRTDAIDDDCRAPAPCLTRSCPVGPELCDDRCDNDRDRLPDCVDPDCAADPRCSGCVPDAPDEDAFERCTDGVDNDCDGFTDCCDWPSGGCPGAFTCDYVWPEDCDNGLDDDFDGLADCDSPVCALDVACTCAPWAPEDCGNGLDDDLDGRTDADDFECPAECW